MTHRINLGVNIGVIGLGRAFTLMLPTFLHDSRVKLVAATDPIDIASASLAIGSPLGGGSQNRANTTLPNYEANSSSQAAQKWAQFRADSLNTSLHSLFDPILKRSGDKKSGLMAQSSLNDFLTWFDIITDPAASFVSDSLFGIAPPAADGKPAPAPPFSVLFLAKEPPYALPKEVEKVDYRDMEMKMLESFKEMRKWDGVAIEE